MENLFRQATPEDKSSILKTIEGVLQSYDEKNFNGLISRLLEMDKVQTEIYPEEFHQTYINFFLDYNMWKWIDEKAKAIENYEAGDEDDLIASKYIIGDLMERLAKNEVFAGNE